MVEFIVVVFLFRVRVRNVPDNVIISDDLYVVKISDKTSLDVNYHPSPLFFLS